MAIPLGCRGPEWEMFARTGGCLLFWVMTWGAPMHMGACVAIWIDGNISSTKFRCYIELILCILYQQSRLWHNS